jgi:hypothetical protein
MQWQQMRRGVEEWEAVAAFNINNIIYHVSCLVSLDPQLQPTPITNKVHIGIVDARYHPRVVCTYILNI